MNSTLRAKLMSRMMKNAKGFTLIELLVVIVIVGVLSAVAVPTFLNQVRRSRVAEAQAGLDVVGTSSEIYRFDEGVFPNAWNDMRSGGANGNRYMDAAWSQTAPNYQDPVPTAGGATDIASGRLWTTTSNGGAYVNGAGADLECDNAVGDATERAGFEVETGCNL